MFKKVTEKLIQYKLILIIGGFLVVIIVAVLIFTAYASNVKADIKIEVKPTLSLGPCFNNQVAPKTTIVTPSDGTRYTTGDKVSLTGIAVLECDNSKIDDTDLTWYLDSDTTPFATGSAVSLDNVKVGNHSIKLDSVSGKLKGETTVNITAADPKPQVLGIKAPPPAVDNPPTITSMIVTDTGGRLPVVLKDGDSVTVTDPPATVSFIHGSLPLTLQATAQDDKDGAMNDKNFQWFVGDSPVGTGMNINYTFVPTYCTKLIPITLQVTDSAQHTVSSNINITVVYSSNNCTNVANQGLNLLNLNLQTGL